MQSLITSTPTESYRISLPNRREIGLLFAACAIPLHAWTFAIFVNQLPSLLLQMSISSALVVLAYALAMALIESLLVLGVLIIAVIALPRRIVKDRGVALVALGFLITFLWVIPVHFQGVMLNRLSWDLSVYRLFVIGWLLIYLGVLFFFSYQLHRRPRFHWQILTFLERLSLPACICVIIDAACLITIILRNLR